MLNNAVDALDRRIMSALERNGRLSNAELAKAVGLSPSPCLRRVRRLEKAGYIRGYHAILDRPALGFGVTAYARLDVDWAYGDALREKIRGLPEVVACYILTGEAGVLLEIVARDLAEYSKFLFGVLYNVPGIRAVRSSVLLEVVKGLPPVPLYVQETKPAKAVAAAKSTRRRRVRRA